jgi:iron complex outermembrane receptor protein
MMRSRKCRGHQGPASAVRLRCTGWSTLFQPEKFADAHTFKTNFSQKLFSNTLGSNLWD